jgi:hypothetical protein
MSVLDLSPARSSATSPTPPACTDRLAPDLNRGFTSNGKADSVTVFNLQTLAPIAEIKISGHGPDAIIYDAPSKRIYVQWP